ncbi:MAG: ATP-grasp domain-containing protein [Gemmatimonadetes bacterium]|nr:ATP-grasp domain-containing protein [Gemmatimonadota bacterium]NIO31504.1 ATP-grasp domain-containing protein [Gemmatimonadota bacterium]
MKRTDNYLIVAESQDHGSLSGGLLRTPHEYLEGRAPGTVAEDATVVNLCRSYQYLSRGYYVSLLADARRQRAVPSLRMIEEITSPYAYFMALRAAGVETIDFRVVGGRRILPRLIVPNRATGAAPEHGESLLSSTGIDEPARYSPLAGEYVDVISVFGRTSDARFRKHCASVFKVCPFPLLSVRIYREESRWKVGQLSPVSIGQIGAAELALLNAELARGRPAGDIAIDTKKPHRIAVLMDESDPFAPSDANTLRRLQRAGQRLGVRLEEIGRDDFSSLAEYDALFLRVVTGMDHYSFLFAQRAKSLGIPVIDDPQTTVRCSNKIYLHELFGRAGLPTPRTLTISRKTSLREMEALGYPLIVKQPDGTFSAAVKRVAAREELEKVTRELFRRSPLLTLQEFRPTEFDWRIAVLDGAVLFACKYYMAKGHWQVIGETPGGRRTYGKVVAVPVADTPESVRALALQAAALIGDGLYGVDIKETDEGVVIIEINDNPDIWVGEEDAAEGDRLYDAVIRAFVHRIEESRRHEVPA